MALLIVIKRLIGAVLFIFYVAIFGITVFPFLLIFFGINKANAWMDRNIPFSDWID